MKRGANHRSTRVFWAQAIIVAICAASIYGHDAPEYSSSTVLVRLSGAGKPSHVDTDIVQRYGLSDPESLFPLTARARGTGLELRGWTSYRIPENADPGAIADSIQSLGYVAQPNYLYRLLQTPNDEFWNDQWAVKNIGLEHVWQDLQNRSRDSVIVAVIDTGIDYNHPDLAGRIWRNLAEVNGTPGVDDDGNGYVDDYFGWDFTYRRKSPKTGDRLDGENDPFDTNGHGTFVSGVIAAEINNSIGIAGAAPTALIMPLRAGAELDFGGTFLKEEDIASAVVYAVENGARVINMSFGSRVSAPLMRDVIAYAEHVGVTIVASAGNERVGHLLYPAAYDETIAVGAIDEENNSSDFTSWGENLDLVAPGSSVLTTRPGGGYQRVWGTSISAPYVAAACANLLSLAPELTPRQIRSMIRAGTIDMGQPGWDPKFGAGRLHLPTLLGVTSDPSAEILAPLRPDGADSSVRWAAFVAGTPPVAWTLTYGVGTEPNIWTGIASGVLSVPMDTVKGIVATAALPETTYTLRLSVSDALGKTRSDRTLLTINHSPPVFTQPPRSYLRWLDDRPFAVATWETDDLTTGEIVFTSGEHSGVPIRLPVESEARNHFIEIPSELLAQPDASATVVAVNRAGLISESGVFSLPDLPPLVPIGGFEHIASLPHGALMPMTSDFDGDGVPEIALTPSSRAAYDTVSFYEITPTGSARLEFEVPVPMRPLAVADLNQDGLSELIGISHSGGEFSVLIVEQNAPNEPPSNVVWHGRGMLAPTVGDIDQNGTPDLLTLIEPHRNTLGLFEAQDGDWSNFRRVGTIGDWPEGSQERFGIWRAVGDFTGDGVTEVALGTESGTVVVYEHAGSGAFTRTRTIEGRGDATRVWGGLDVTGDGRDNFAVLRFLAESRFDPERRTFRLEVYADGVEPVFAREFADPRTDGNGFTAGPFGPDGENALIVSFPPRIYAVSPQGGGSDGIVWYSKTRAPSQPLLANVDGAGGTELIYSALDSTRVLRVQTGTVSPMPPRDIRVTVRDSASVAISWLEEAHLNYRIWFGDDPDSMSPYSDADPRPPFIIDGLATGVPVSIALQAVDPSLSDSLGSISEPQIATPRPPPQIVSADFVDPSRVRIVFSAPLSPESVTRRSFAIDQNGGQSFPTSVVFAHMGKLVLLSLPPSISGDDGVNIHASVVDTSGAERTSSVFVPRTPALPSSGLVYAMTASANAVSIGFSSAIDPQSLSQETVAIVGGPDVLTVEPTDSGKRDFLVTLSHALTQARPAVIEVRGARTPAGDAVAAAAVISGNYVSPDALVAAVGVLQIAQDTLWFVTTHPLAVDAMSVADVAVTPRIAVKSIEPGPAPEILVVVLDPQTPVGPWQDEYRVGVFARMRDGRTAVLDVPMIPVGSSVLTGRLVASRYIDPATISMTFDTTLAAADRQPDGAIRVEPGIVLDTYEIVDSVVTLRLNERTRLGAWGITYFVHVEGLLDVNGVSMSELAAITVPVSGTFDSFTVFPQPYRPARDADLRFGGLPPHAEIRIYSLDGVLVRTLNHSDTGGVAWDGRNEGGLQVRSGIYVYVVEASIGRRTGKIAVIR